MGLGKETTAGIAVAPTHWIPQQDFTVEDTIERIYDESGIGTRYKGFAGDTSMVSAAGNINGLVYDRTFGLIALAAMGSVSTAAHGSATGVKVHTFSTASSVPSFTIGSKDGNENVRYPYSMLNTLEINVDQGQYATFNSAWLSRKSGTASNTVAFTDENRFRPQDVTIKIADSVALLGAATALRVKSLAISINNNLITEPSLGTTDPDFYTGVLETSISMGRLYLDATMKAMVFGSTQKAMSISFTRTDVQIGSASPTNPSVVFTFQPGFFAEWNRDGGLDDLKNENFTYKPIFSTSASKQFDLVVTNTETSY